MCFAGGMPRAVAIVSPVNDGSRTTRAPCTPESVDEKISTVEGAPLDSSRLYIRVMF